MLKRLRQKVQNLNNLEVLVILIVVAVVSAFSSALDGAYLDKNWWADVSQGLVTEMAGAIATFWLINLIFEGRRKREEKVEALEEKKAALIRQMGSRVNEEAIRAVEELRHHGWLFDGSLHKVKLGGANLQGTNLFSANLQGAMLSGVRMQGAELMVANLQETNLGGANLQDAELLNANLQDAILMNANLRGAKLLEANLQGVDLRGVQFDENTILPDYEYWTSKTDVSQFTDPSHPQFWRSDKKFSPAYRGKGDSE